MDEIGRRLRKFRDERDWAQFHTPQKLAISIALEAAELLEIFQWGDGSSALTSDQTSRASSEVADILIYLIYFCDKAKIDLLKATRDKISQNELRYPITESKGVAGRDRD